MLNKNPVIGSIFAGFQTKLFTVAEKLDLIAADMQADMTLGRYSGGAREPLREIIRAIERVKILEPVVDPCVEKSVKNAKNFALKLPDPPCGPGVILLDDCGCRGPVTLGILHDLPVWDPVTGEHIDFLCCLSSLFRKMSQFIGCKLDCDL